MGEVKSSKFEHIQIHLCEVYICEIKPNNVRCTVRYKRTKEEKKKERIR